MVQNWSTKFLSFGTAAALTQLPVLPSYANPPVSRQSTAPLSSLQAINGYPIANQIIVSGREILQPQDIRPLPGGLDSVPVFNSNSPEAIREPGILLSTFPPQGKLEPNAHLNYPLQGRFDVFAHHIAKTDKPDTTPTLYNGLLVYNPSATKTIAISVLKAGSFLSNPEAPYVELPSFLENPLGRIFSGPGSRLTDALLRSNRLSNWPSRIYLPPKSTQMLMNLPTPVPRPALSRLSVLPTSRLTLPTILQQKFSSGRNIPSRPIVLNTAASSNTRSTMLQLYSDGPVYMAYLAMYAAVTPNGMETVPRKSDWENLVVNGKLVQPRDLPPSSLDSETNQFFYGRGAGVSRGSQWQAKITDTPRSKHLTVPLPGDAFSYGLSTLPRGTFGTGQVQSAPMLVRYPDTAWMSHGNYGVHYEVSLPLYNPSETEQKVAVSIQTPLKQNRWNKGLRFLNTLPNQVFFRGTIRVRYKDDSGTPQLRYYHLNQRQGQQGEPLAMVTLPAKENRLISLDYFYPPDATPPQALTIQTLATMPSTQRSAYGIEP